VLDAIDADGSDSWRLAAPTDAGEVSIRLGVDELQALYELLAGAQGMRSLEERIGVVAVGERRGDRPPSGIVDGDRPGSEQRGGGRLHP